MPRRKRNFIDRSRAKTFQLVNAPTETNPSNQVFIPLSSDSTEQQKIFERQGEVEADAAVRIPREGEYSRTEYELGEYGFPEDGYDYSRHFRPIGGGGGVFMDAITGLPDPDAVSSSRRRPKASTFSEKNNEPRLRNNSDANNQQLKQPESPPRVDSMWLKLEDVQNRIHAMEEIKRDRKHHPDLDEVIAFLDSDGELDSTASDPLDLGPDAVEGTFFADSNSDTQSGLLEDDFIALANAPSEGENQHEADDDALWKNIREPYRKLRDLDEQFEKFMNGFQMDSTDEEYDEIEEELIEQANKQRNDGHPFDFEQFEEKRESDLIDGMATLNCDGVVNKTEQKYHKLQPQNAASGAERPDEREKEFEQYAAAEFDSGIEHLLGSYARATPNETFEAFDGLDKAREALRKAELEEQEFIAKLNSLDVEGVENDPDLDVHFDEMYKEEEKWDCETILSTYTNLENHPSVIDAPSRYPRSSTQRAPIIRLDPRIQAPLELSHAERPVTSAPAVDYGTRRSVAGVSRRTRGESKDEKKARKAAAKEISRERRALKSELKKAFGVEQTKQGRHATAIGKAKVAVKF